MVFRGWASARSATELGAINRNKSMLYIHKLRDVIAYYLAAKAFDLMTGFCRTVREIAVCSRRELPISEPPRLFFSCIIR